MTAPEVAPNWTHPGRVLRVIDGDTLIVELDLGRYPHKVLIVAPIRLASLYAPELRAPGGKEALAALKDLTRTGEVVVRTRKPDPRDPYGRLVADVWNIEGASLAKEMVAAGHGVEQKP